MAGIVTSGLTISTVPSGSSILLRHFKGDLFINVCDEVYLVMVQATKHKVCVTMSCSFECKWGGV